MSEIQHDPTPWFFGHYIGTDDNCYVGSEEGNMRIIGAGRMLGEANAAYIVNCVNSHASLVEENKRMREALSGLIEKYEEIVLDDNAGRSLKDIDLVRAKEALNA